MTRKPLFILGLLLFFNVCILSFLVTTSSSPNDKKNGFTRQGFSGMKAVQLHELALGEILYKICGATPHRFFFIGQDPRSICSADMELKRMDSFHIPFPLDKRTIVAYDLEIDSPYIHLYANNLSAILSARLDDTIVHKTVLPTRLFTAVVAISSQSLVVKAFDSSGMRQVFKKINLATNKVEREAPVIEDNKDAGFSADGMLRYDSTTHRLLYLQFYVNRFFCIDTNLNVLYTGKTIDTTNTNPVATRRFSARLNKLSLLPSVPLHIINHACTTQDGNMYVLSTLKADNEKNRDFRGNAVVDIYSISNGKYKESFYIPDLHDEKAQNLFMANGLLLVYYNRYIGAFRLPAR